MDYRKQMNDNLFKAMRYRKELEEKNKELYKKDSNDRLRKNAEKKIRTTFIGAIDSFEKLFGHLWGAGKKDLTHQEKMWKEVWETARKEVLDKGNNQLRALRSEIEEYTVEWNQYKLNLPVMKLEEYKEGNY